MLIFNAKSEKKKTSIVATKIKETYTDAWTRFSCILRLI